jgi:hypothetical protein
MSISYSAVVLDEVSSNRLKQEFGNMVPDGWEYLGHHMTIKMGELPVMFKSRIGESVELIVEKIGMDDRAMAVKVLDGGLSTNKLPHITLAVNRKNGGKPFHSNKIPLENFKSVHNRIKVIGYIKEIPHK